MVLTVLYICIETSNQSINSSNQSVYTTTQTKFLAYKATKEATDYGQITLASTTENPKTRVAISICLYPCVGYVKRKVCMYKLTLKAA